MKKKRKKLFIMLSFYCVWVSSLSCINYNCNVEAKLLIFNNSLFNNGKRVVLKFRISLLWTTLFVQVLVSNRFWNLNPYPRSCQTWNLATQPMISGCFLLLSKSWCLWWLQLTIPSAIECFICFRLPKMGVSYVFHVWTTYYTLVEKKKNTVFCNSFIWKIPKFLREFTGC